MAIQTMSGNATLADGIYNEIQNYRGEKIVSPLFSRRTLLAALVSQSQNRGELLKTTTLDVIGSNNLDPVRQAAAGEHDYRITVHKQKVDGTKYMGIYDTQPDLPGQENQAENYTQALFRFAHLTTPIVIPRSYIEAANEASNREAAGTRVIRKAYDEAMNVHLDTLHQDLWRAAPTSQSADRWDKPLGIVHAMNDDNTYGNINRSATTYWDGIRVTSAKAATLSLIDDANIQQGVMDKTEGVNLVLCGKANYLKFRAEALANRGTAEVSTIPEMLEYGVRMECIKYNNATILYDPFLDNSGDTDWSTFDTDLTDSTKIVAMLNTSAWEMHFMPGKQLNTPSVVYEGEYAGRRDAFYGFIESAFRLPCEMPWANVLYTNVS